METNAKNNAQATKSGNAVLNDKKTQFVAGNPVNAVSKGEEGKPKEEPVKTGEEAGKDLKPGAPAPVEQAKQAVPAAGLKSALNLDETIKLLETLHVKKVQRDKLLGTINNLEAFNLDLEKEADETGSSYYQGCVLKITDDERREFVTKNPVIIQAVAQYVNSLCVDKLAEIEAGIIIPA